MKKYFVLILFAIVLTLSLFGCTPTAESVYKFDDNNKYFTITDEQQVENVTNVNVDWVLGEVNIIKSNEVSQITFHEENNKTEDEYKLRYRIDNNSLIIRFMKSGTRIPNDHSWNKKLTVLIPTHINNLTLNAVSADVNVEGISVGFFTVNAVSGRQKLAVDTTDKLTARSVSGDVSFEGSTKYSADVDTVSGNVQLKLKTSTPEIAIDTVSGNAMVELPNTISGYKATLSSISGKLTCNGTQYRNEYTYLVTEGAQTECDIQANSVSGNLEVKSEQ